MSNSASDRDGLRSPTLGKGIPPEPEKSASLIPADGSLLGFNDLLRNAGLDPGQVRLARHVETRAGRTVHQAMCRAAREGDPRFDEYQAMQGGPAFRDAAHVAGFVPGENPDEAAFVGVWRILGSDRGPIHNPFIIDAPRRLTDTSLHYRMARDPRFEAFRARLTVLWGEGTRSWVQRADRQPKRIVRLVDVPDPPFPGWRHLRVRLSGVAGLPQVWREVLANARGVYLLVHDDGRQYVGSATGMGGFLGPWLGYADGHGGNVRLRELAGDPAAYTVAVLEVAAEGGTILTSDVLARETWWKTTLGSRVHGLNAN